MKNPFRFLFGKKKPPPVPIVPEEIFLEEEKINEVTLPPYFAVPDEQPIAPTLERNEIYIEQITEDDINEMAKTKYELGVQDEVPSPKQYKPQKVPSNHGAPGFKSF